MYLSDKDYTYQRSAVTPRVTKLIDVDMTSVEDELLCFSSSIKKSNNKKSHNNTELNKSKKMPLQQVRRPIEEDKYEVYLNKVPSYQYSSENSGKSSIQKSTKGGFDKKIQNDQKLRRLSDENSSEFFIKAVAGPNSDPRPAKISNKAKWRTWGCHKANIKVKKVDEKPATTTQMQIYQLAMKKSTEENDELRDIISGLRQQISELKIQLNERDEAIDEMSNLINKLTDGELNEKLHENED